MAEGDPNVEVPADMCSSDVVEQAAGLVGVAIARSIDDTVLYDDLGALLSMLMGIRADIRKRYRIES